MFNNILQDQARRNRLAPYAGRRLGVAVSGGSDSLGLLFLLHIWGQASLFVASVNHGLRPEARAEQAYVGKICATLGVPFFPLDVVLEGQNVMQAARHARYIALAEWAYMQNLSAVAVGHTLDDQVETFLMRGFRGSGLAGLSAMRPEQDLHFGPRKVRIFRPILDLRRQVLRDALEARGVAWVEDPSNQDLHYDRVRMRHVLEICAAQGFEPATLARTIDNLTLDSEAYTTLLKREFMQANKIVAQAQCQVSREWLVNLPEGAGLRWVAQNIRFFTGEDYPPRLSSTKHVYARLVGREIGRLTLGGVIFQTTPKTIKTYLEPHFAEQNPQILKQRFKSAFPLVFLGDQAPQYASLWRALGLGAYAARGLPAYYGPDGVLVVYGLHAGACETIKPRLNGGLFV